MAWLSASCWLVATLYLLVALPALSSQYTPLRTPAQHRPQGGIQRITESEGDESVDDNSDYGNGQIPSNDKEIYHDYAQSYTDYVDSEYSDAYIAVDYYKPSSDSVYDYRSDYDYSNYVYPQSCGYDDKKNLTICGFNCTYGNNWHFKCNETYQQCTYASNGVQSCNYTTGIELPSLCGRNERGAYLCGEKCSYTSTNGSTIACETTLMQCAFTDESKINCTYNTTHVYEHKCAIVENGSKQVCGYNCSLSELGDDLKCKEVYEVCQYSDNDEEGAGRYECKRTYTNYEMEDFCWRNEKGKWECGNGMSCKETSKGLVCITNSDDYYYLPYSNDYKFDGCGQSQFNNLYICGINCTYNYQYNLDCDYVYSICDYNSNSYASVEKSKQCIFNTRYVQPDACGSDENAAQICGYNCSYTSESSEALKCEEVYQTCSTDVNGYYTCKYSPNYTMSSACNYDPEGNYICGNECQYVLDTQIMCKYLQYKCHYPTDGSDYWCLYNKSTTAEENCKKKKGKWECPDGCYVDKEENYWCYENGTSGYTIYEEEPYYDDDWTGWSAEMCGYADGNKDQSVCGRNCTYDRNYNVDCEIITYNCTTWYDKNGYYTGNNCTYNTSIIYDSLCQYDGHADKCGRNCSYYETNNGSIGVDCTIDYSTCGYSEKSGRYECKYNKDYVSPGECGYDIERNMICGTSCKHPYGNETIKCKDVNTTCHFDEWGSTLCTYKRTENNDASYCYNGYCGEDNCTKEADGSKLCHSNASDWNEYNYDCKMNRWNQLNCQQIGADCKEDEYGNWYCTYEHSYQYETYPLPDYESGCYTSYSGRYICQDSIPEGVSEDFYNIYVSSIVSQFLPMHYQYNYRDGNKISIEKLYVDFMMTSQLWATDKTLDEKKAHFEDLLDGYGEKNKKLILQALDDARASVDKMKNEKAKKFAQKLVKKFDNGELFTDVYTLTQLVWLDAEKELSDDALSDYMTNGPFYYVSQKLIEQISTGYISSEEYPYIQQFNEWYEQENKAEKKCAKLDCESSNESCSITFANNETTTACVAKDSINQDQCLDTNLCAKESSCIDLNDKTEPVEYYTCICLPQYNDNSNSTEQPTDSHIVWQGVSCEARA